MLLISMCSFWLYWSHVVYPIINGLAYFILIFVADACPLSPDPSLAGMTIEMIKKRKQIKEANEKGPVKCLLTTALLKWRLGAWRIKVLPLLAASPKIEIMPPLLAQQRTQPWAPTQRERSRHPSHWKTSVEKREKKIWNNNNNKSWREGWGGGEKMAERTSWADKTLHKGKLNVPVNHISLLLLSKRPLTSGV